MDTIHVCRGSADLVAVGDEDAIHRRDRALAILSADRNAASTWA